MRLGTIFYNDFELLDAYGPLEMFGALGDKIELVTIAEQAGPVKSSPGPKTLADYGFDDAPELDMILVPGGIGTIPELENDALIRFLQERCPQSKVTMSVCTGSALLAKAGLLDTMPATSNKMFFELARSQGPMWIGRNQRGGWTQGNMLRRRASPLEPTWHWLSLNGYMGSKSQSRL